MLSRVKYGMYAVVAFTGKGAKDYVILGIPIYAVNKKELIKDLKYLVNHEQPNYLNQNPEIKCIYKIGTWDSATGKTSNTWLSIKHRKPPICNVADLVDPKALEKLQEKQFQGVQK